jgi:hypothetical protein
MMLAQKQFPTAACESCGACGHELTTTTAKKQHRFNFNQRFDFIFVNILFAAQM